MDAISFVLGVPTKALRSNNLKELNKLFRQEPTVVPSDSEYEYTVVTEPQPGIVERNGRMHLEYIAVDQPSFPLSKPKVLIDLPSNASLIHLEVDVVLTDTGYRKPLQIGWELDGRTIRLDLPEYFAPFAELKIHVSWPAE